MSFYDTTNLPNFNPLVPGLNQVNKYQEVGVNQRIKTDAGNGIDITYSVDQILKGLIVRDPEVAESNETIDTVPTADEIIAALKLNQQNYNKYTTISAGFYIDFAIYNEGSNEQLIVAIPNTGVSFGVGPLGVGLIFPGSVAWFRMTVVDSVDDGDAYNYIYISQISGFDYLPFLSAPGPTSVPLTEERLARIAARRAALTAPAPVPTTLTTTRTTRTTRRTPPTL
jgi:hypothetical protein